MSRPTENLSAKLVKIHIAETLILADECVPGCGQWRQT